MKQDGSMIKHQVVGKIAENKRKVLPIAEVPEEDLKKIMEIGKTFNNLVTHAAWGMIVAWMDAQRSEDSMLHAEKEDKMARKMAQISGFRDMKSWISQRIVEGQAAEKMLQGIKESQLKGERK